MRMTVDQPRYEDLAPRRVAQAAWCEEEVGRPLASARPDDLPFTCHEQGIRDDLELRVDQGGSRNDQIRRLCRSRCLPFLSILDTFI